MNNDHSDLYSSISPKYIMELIPKVENALWEMFDTSKYKKVKQYILKWHEENQGYNIHDYWENFSIVYKNGVIDLSETLSQMPNDILIKIVIDLGIDTPGFLPIVPKFKNILKDKNQNAFQSFERAIKNTHENPDEAISLANSTLEGIIKTILSDETFSDLQYNSRDTLYELTKEVLNRFKMYPKMHQEMDEVRNIGSGLLTACQNIEKLRSTKTNSHGKAQEDYIIAEMLWANFIVNSVATIGIFLTEFFEKKYMPDVKVKEKEINPDDIPF
ncbi:MAG TPA: abortive infection family protein [Candidatus Woesebacteria bacterium]|nr:abortive infection family protein [Candidatus Woesebacteria bacterium]